MNQFLLASFQALIIASDIAPKPLSQLPSELQPMLRALQEKGFKVVIALPPRRQSYGMFQRKTKTLWISPITFPLGIVRQTFLHEAVHAVQSCPSGNFTPIGWKFNLNPIIEREISAILLNNYNHTNRAIEKEAFYLQGQPDAIPLLMKALKQRCL